MALLKDTILENRYRIDTLLSEGGMGAVYKAFDTNLDTPVAIKENFFQTPQSIRQFKQEAHILARLRHPNLPRVIHHFMANKQQYLVMDFIEGRDLWEIIQKQGHPLEEQQALTYMLQICDAVSYLHRQTPPIIHRDIKPQNIKITPDDQAVLVDFGISKVGDDDSRTRTGAHAITPGFSPPEQHGGTGTTPVSDIYALGATLYALLVGKRPPDSVSRVVGGANYEPPHLLNPKLSYDVSAAIEHAMQIHQADRPQSVSEWRGQLAGVLAGSTRMSIGDPGEAPTVKSSDPLKPTLSDGTSLSPTSENERAVLAEPILPRLWIGAGAVVVILVIGLVIFLTNRTSAEPTTTVEATVAIANQPEPTEPESSNLVVNTEATVGAVLTAAAQEQATTIAQLAQTSTAVAAATATEQTKIEQTKPPETPTPQPTSTPTALNTPTPILLENTNCESLTPLICTGVLFPQGPISFADRVINFKPASNGDVLPPYDDPTSTLGLPDNEVIASSGVALGNTVDTCDGELVLEFVDNALVDVPGDDLYIFEVGPKVEATEVYISVDGQTWIALEPIEGSTRGINIANKVAPGQKFYFVKLCDFPDGTTSGSPFAGPDIDAIGAIGTEPLTTQAAKAEISQMTTTSDINVRAGPGTDYERVGELAAGTKAIIIGRNEDSSWWKISFPGAPDNVAWISASLGTAENTEAVALAAIPPTPTVAPIPTPTPDILSNPGTLICSISDPVEDHVPGYIDFTEVSIFLSGEQVTVVYTFKDLPEELPFNRPETAGNSEYYWRVLMDIDVNNLTGGTVGEEYVLSAMSRTSSAGLPEISTPIQEAVELHVVASQGNRFMSVVGPTYLAVDSASNKLTLSGQIPGITRRTRFIITASDFISPFFWNETECISN